MTLKASGPSYLNLPLPLVLEKGRAAATLEVRAHSATCIADAYLFYQVPVDILPVPTVLGNTQDTRMGSISGTAKITVNTLSLVYTAITQLDVTNTGYPQTLSTFNTVVNGITRVFHPNGRRLSSTDDHA